MDRLQQSSKHGMEDILCITSDVSSEEEHLAIKIWSENHLVHRTDCYGIELSAFRKLGPHEPSSSMPTKDQYRTMDLQNRVIVLTLMNRDDKREIIRWCFILWALLD